MAASLGTVMIVDDEELDQTIYRRVMNRSGVVDQVLSYTLPDEALAFLSRKDRQPVHVLFLDINMPRMDGFEFIDKAVEVLGDELADLTLLLLTTSMDPAQEKRAAEMPWVKGFVQKPLTVDDLKALAEQR